MIGITKNEFERALERAKALDVIIETRIDHRVGFNTLYCWHYDRASERPIARQIRTHKDPEVFQLSPEYLFLLGTPSYNLGVSEFESGFNLASERLLRETPAAQLEEYARGRQDPFAKGVRNAIQQFRSLTTQETS